MPLEFVLSVFGEVEGPGNIGRLFPLQNHGNDFTLV